MVLLAVVAAAGIWYTGWRKTRGEQVRIETVIGGASALALLVVLARRTWFDYEPSMAGVMVPVIFGICCALRLLKPPAKPPRRRKG